VSLPGFDQRELVARQSVVIDFAVSGKIIDVDGEKRDLEPSATVVEWGNGRHDVGGSTFLRAEVTPDLRASRLLSPDDFYTIAAGDALENLVLGGWDLISGLPSMIQGLGSAFIGLANLSGQIRDERRIASHNAARYLWAWTDMQWGLFWNLDTASREQQMQLITDELVRYYGDRFDSADQVRQIVNTAITNYFVKVDDYRKRAYDASSYGFNAELAEIAAEPFRPIGQLVLEELASAAAVAAWVSKVSRSTELVEQVAKKEELFRARAAEDATEATKDMAKIGDPRITEMSTPMKALPASTPLTAKHDNDAFSIAACRRIGILPGAIVVAFLKKVVSAHAKERSSGACSGNGAGGHAIGAVLDVPAEKQLTNARGHGFEGWRIHHAHVFQGTPHVPLDLDHVVDIGEATIHPHESFERVLSGHCAGWMNPTDPPLAVDIDQQRFASLGDVIVPAMCPTIEKLFKELLNSERTTPWMLCLNAVQHVLGNGFRKLTGYRQGRAVSHAHRHGVNVSRNATHDAAKCREIISRPQIILQPTLKILSSLRKMFIARGILHLAQFELASVEDARTDGIGIDTWLWNGTPSRHVERACSYRASVQIYSFLHPLAKFPVLGFLLVDDPMIKIQVPIPLFPAQLVTF